jgi:hypothetical protein
MQSSDADTQYPPPRKRKHQTEDNEIAKEAPSIPSIPETSEKTKCVCPICGCLLSEEDVNSHLDICLNRSTVLEMVREEDRKPVEIKSLKTFGLGKGDGGRKGGQGKGVSVRGKSGVGKSVVKK